MSPRRPLLPLALACASAAAAPAPQLAPADLTRSVAPLVENQLVQAVSIGVIQPAGPTTAHAGVLAPDRAAPPDDRTLYEIGSVTKVFTALLLADAVVRGEVTLDTPIARLLPADVVLPGGAAERITLRMLATHTSGLPRIPAEIPPDDYRDPYAAYGEAELWATLRRVQLDFPPGTKAAYSNLAAGLLGTLLARRAGVTFEALLAERIAKPLQLEDTVVTLSDEQRSRRAPPFNASGQPVAPWEFQALAGAGAIRSTLHDLLRFATAVLHPETSPLREAIELAWARQDLAATMLPGGQALGWLIAGDKQTRWHNGMTGGYQAALFVNRERGIASIVLGNRSTPAGTTIAEELIRRAAGAAERPAPNRDRPEVALTPAELDRCTGTFRLSPEMVFVLERRNLALFITPTGQATDRLYAAGPNTFFSRRVPAEVVFELPDDAGPATALTLKQGGRQFRAPRQ